MKRKKTLFDDIGALIPGYIAYTRRDEWRKCDKILRKHIANKLLFCELNLKRTETPLACTKNDIIKVENIRKRINTLADKCKYNTYGTSSLFSTLIIEDRELQIILKIDLDISQRVEHLNKHIRNMPLSDIELLLTEIENILAKRMSFIRKFK